MSIHRFSRVPVLLMGTFLACMAANAQTWKKLERNKQTPPPSSVQDPPSPPDEETVLPIPDEPPSFPGGGTALARWLADSLRYPAMALHSGIAGKVHVSFIVEKDGQRTSEEVLRGIGGGCDEEALRLARAMPPWVPATREGKPVRARSALIVTFTPPADIGEASDEGEAQEPAVLKDAPPSFPGGDAELEKYVRSTVRYPVAAWRAGIKGIVYTVFTVEADGRITNVRVLRGIGGGCDEEAVRVVGRMPPWMPAMRDGQPVPAQGNVPVVFERKGL